MSELGIKLSQILSEKSKKIKPENIKSGVQIFNVIGTYEGVTLEVSGENVEVSNNTLIFNEEVNE